MWATFCHRDLPAKAGSLLKLVINLVLLPFYLSLKYLQPVTRKRQAKDPDIGQSIVLRNIYDFYQAKCYGLVEGLAPKFDTV